MSNLNLQKLSELCTLYSGGTPSTSNESYWNGNLNWMSSGETSNKLIYGTKLKISEKGVAESSTRLAHSGDTVVATAGEGKTRGQTSYLLTDTYVNQSIVVLEADKTKIDNKFLFYAVSNSYNRMRALSDAAGIRGSLPCKLLNNFEINTFNLDIENKIGQFLFNIDLKIENNNKINAELESLAKTIYDYWFLQFEFPNEEGKPYKSSGGKMVWNEELKREIPEGWKNGNLYDIAEFTNGLACQKHRPIKNNQRLPVIKIREMHNGFTSETEWVRDDIPQKYVIDDGDILFSWSATLETIIWTGGQGALNQHIFKVSEKNCAKYYVFMQLAEYVKNFVAMAEARKTTMGHITSDHLNQSRVVLPCTKVIDSFEQKVTPLFPSIIKNKQESIELSKLREFLLPLLMNGQVGFIENEVTIHSRPVGMTSQAGISPLPDRV